MVITAVKSSWRVQDVFFILFLYLLTLGFFLYVEVMIFGKWVLEDKNLSSAALFLEDTIDASIIIILPIFFVIKVYRADLQDIGITLRSFKKNVLIGLFVGSIMWIALSIIGIVIESFFGKGPDHPYIHLLETSNNLVSYFALLISITILAPLSEEIYFRGFTYTVFEKSFGKWIAVILSSSLFTLMHFNLWWVFQIFVMGIFLSLLFDYTKSIVPIVIAHSCFNILAIYIGNFE